MNDVQKELLDSTFKAFEFKQKETKSLRKEIILKQAIIDTLKDDRYKCSELLKKETQRADKAEKGVIFWRYVSAITTTALVLYAIIK
jgi:hypothetical protein